jgi:hypothetical protein
VLFVAFFSVFLVLAAVAIDQGFWYGRRRISQGEVDAAARAGAFGYFAELGDEAAASSAAQENASANGATGVSIFPDATGCTIDGQRVNGAPSINVRVVNNVPGFFTSLPLIGGGNAGVNVGAQATACVGGVEILEVDNIANPPPSGNLLKGIPIALQHDVGGSCFDSSDDLVVGRECALLDGLGTPGDRHVLFTTPSNNECEGTGGNADPSDIASGIDYKCEVRSGNGCSGNMQCVRVDTTNLIEQIVAFASLDSRLSGAPGCDGSFSGAFGSGNAPPKFGGSSADRSRVYTQTDCFNSRRLVVLPVVEDSGGSSPRNVRGFATVYVTGCYRGSDPMDNPSASPRDCGTAVFETLFGIDWEIRGVPINMYVTNGSTGSITSTERSSALTIQTVQ